MNIVIPYRLTGHYPATCLRYCSEYGAAPCIAKTTPWMEQPAKGESCSPSHMAGNQDASQTGNAADTAPVDALQALDTDGMTREELQALARELKAQGQTNKQIAAHVGKSEATVSRWLR